MRRSYAAFVFGLLGLVAAWAILHDLERGVTSSDGLWSFSAAVNPGGFYLAIGAKLSMLGFCAAELMRLARLSGDPIAALDGLFRGPSPR